MVEGWKCYRKREKKKKEKGEQSTGDSDEEGGL